jgi:hypothetical protein
VVGKVDLKSIRRNDPCAYFASDRFSGSVTSHPLEFTFCDGEPRLLSSTKPLYDSVMDFFKSHDLHAVRVIELEEVGDLPAS